MDQELKSKNITVTIEKTPVQKTATNTAFTDSSKRLIAYMSRLKEQEGEGKICLDNIK